MFTQNINSIISVIPVTDFDFALQWYIKLFGREPDVLPMEGIAEWQLVENAWIQVCVDPERAGGTTVVVGVDDIESKYQTLFKATFSVGEIVEYPEVIKMFEILDPAGNKISFVEDISNV